MRCNPQLKCVITRVYSTNPRKPNSANRKVAKVSIREKRSLLSAIKGVPNSLKKFSRVWVAGAGFKDTPGVKTHLIIGKDSFLPPIGVQKRRSIYGVKKTILWLIYKLLLLSIILSTQDRILIFLSLIILKFLLLLFIFS